MRWTGWLSDRASYLTAPWTAQDEVRTEQWRIRHEMQLLKENVMATAAEYAARVDAATSELANDLKAVRDRLTAVEAAAEGDKQAAVDAALAELDGPISRLEALGRDEVTPDDETQPETSAEAPVDEPDPENPPVA